MIRISRENHTRLKDLMADLIDEENKKPTLNEMMEKLLDSMDRVRNGELVYVVDNMVFTDIAIARGESIQRAVAMKDVPVWPKVAVIIGEDHG